MRLSFERTMTSGMTNDFFLYDVTDSHSCKYRRQQSTKWPISIPNANICGIIQNNW